jgi:signal transduction histidine kinase
LSSTLSAFFSSEFFLPHGHCYLWKPAMLGLQIGANAIIALAGLTIAATLGYLVYRLRATPWRLVSLALAALIAVSALTHLFDIWVIWMPLYWLDGAVRGLAALIALLTSLALARLARLALQQAEAAGQLEKQLVGTVARELRTPLSEMQLQLERLRRKLRGGQMPGQEEIVADVEISSQRLIELIEALQHQAAIESDQLTLRVQTLALEQEIAGVVDGLRPRAAQKGLRIDLVVAPELPPLRSDPRLIKLMAGNLLSSAIELAAAGALEVSLSRGEGFHAIRLRDSGPGAGPEDRRRTFEAFARLEAPSSRHAPSVGLGPALVEDTVRALGGRVERRAEPGGAATFTVFLPDLPG